MEYLLGEPGGYEWHLEGVAVGMQSVEGIWTDSSQHREYTSGELVTYCEQKTSSALIQTKTQIIAYDRH